MLTFWGRQNESRQERFCDGVCRREFLRVGAIGAGAVGLTLADVLRVEAASPAREVASSGRRGKSLIQIFLPGGDPRGIRIAEITTKEEADDMRGVSLFAARDQLPGLPDDEFYDADLIGLEVYDTGGALLGRVKTVQNHGADDLLELQLAGTSATTFLPFTKAAVPTVDLASGRIIADPPLGVLPEGKDG